MSQVQVKKGAKSTADVLNVMVTIIRDKPDTYKYGLTAKQVRDFFPLVKHYSLTTYANRLRDLVNETVPRAGRHDVHGKRRFYPLILDEEGLIDHSRCVNCEKPRKET